MAEITQKEKNRLLAAASIVEDGDLAVLKKILEFTDYLEENDVKLTEFFNKIKEEIDAFKETIGGGVEEKTNSYAQKMEECQALMDSCQEMMSEIKASEGQDKIELQKAITTLASDFALKLAEVKALIPQLPPEFDPSGIMQTIKEVEAKIPTLPEELTSEQVRDKLEAIEKEEEKLSMDAIRDLKKKLADLEAEITRAGKVVGGGGPRDVWHNGSGLGKNKITVSSTAPARPAINDIWFVLP